MMKTDKKHKTTQKNKGMGKKPQRKPQGKSRDTGNIGYTRHRTKTDKNTRQHRKQKGWENNRQRKPQDKSRVHNQETMVTLATQETGRRQLK